MAPAHEAPHPGPPNPATAPSRDLALSLPGSHLFAFSLGFALLIAVLGHRSGRLIVLLPFLLLLLFGAFGSSWGWKGKPVRPLPWQGHITIYKGHPRLTWTLPTATGEQPQFTIIGKE